LSALPTDKSSGETVDPRKLVWFLYGPPGIGKSLLASGFGSSVLYLWTSSVKYIDAYKQPIMDWRSFVKAVRELQKLNGKRYSAVVVDTIDLLWMLCRQHVLEARGIEHETDLSHGKGFDMVRREFIPVIAKLTTCGYGVVFVSHAKVRDSNQGGRGVRMDRIVPTLQDSAKGIILPICDVEGYLGFSAEDVDEDTGKRRIFFQPTRIIEAKDWTDRLPKQMELVKDPAANYAELTKHLLSEGRGSTATPHRKKKKKTATKKKRTTE